MLSSLLTPKNQVACVADLKLLAQQRVPKMFYEYAASGSYTEKTLKWNSEDFDKIKLRQRVAVDVSKRTTKPNPQRFLRGKLPSTQSSIPSLPLMLAPIGLCGMQHYNGEIHAANAAAKHNIPFCLSTMSITAIEDLRKETDKRESNPIGDKFFFQLYMMKDREFMKRLIQRAKNANCGALVLTLDLQILGVRYADVKNGLSAPPKLFNIQTLKQLAVRPRWCVQQALFAKRHDFGNIVGHVSGVEDVTSLSSWTSGQFDPSVDWETVRWIREEQWRDKPLIVKGILDEGDALKAAAIGVDAISVSNHGARQLDGAPSSISRLYSISKAVKSKYKNNEVEIHFDGGVSTGQQLFKAYALGADVVHIGRSYVWGLGAMGERGVDLTIEFLRKELDVTMALTGTNTISEIGLDKLIIPSDEVKKEFGII